MIIFDQGKFYYYNILDQDKEKCQLVLDFFIEIISNINFGITFKSIDLHYNVPFDILRIL